MDLNVATMQNLKEPNQADKKPYMGETGNGNKHGMLRNNLPYGLICYIGHMKDSLEAPMDSSPISSLLKEIPVRNSTKE